MRFNPQAKLMRHSARVEEWIRTGGTNPILAEISPTGYCNAKCSWCSMNDKKSKEKLDFGVLFQTLNDLKLLGLKAVNWTGGGEPSIYPKFDIAVKHAMNLDFEQGIFTNGYQELPHQEAFSWIRISITDTGLDRVVPPRVPFGVVLNQTAELKEQEIRGFCLHAREIGACYFQVRPALTGDFKTQPTIEPPYYLKEYESEAFEIHVTEYKYQEAHKPKEYHECYGFNFVPSIDWNGKVTACLYRTLESDYILGDLNKESFLDIWANLPKHVPAVDSCWNCCKNHEINKLLANTKEVEAVNFL